jgi:flagellin-like hook-associated protein FlgL
MLFPQLNQSTIEAIPAPALAKSVIEEIDALVRRIQSLKIATMEMHVGVDIAHIHREIEQLNEQIDRLVYAAYGLSTREIEIIESNIS